MAEVSAAVIKRTQDTLGKQIKKPTLTEKLLRKPPFRFLHDIITSVIKTTGYFDGLYTTEELQSENIKDRDAKIAFLQKAIDVVKFSANENIKVRPAKIVAGLEADKTNEFLQAIGKAIERKIDSTEAVAAVKSGATAEPTKPAKSVGKPKTEKPKAAAAGSSLKKSSVDGNKKTESKTKAGGKSDGKTSTETKKSKPKVTKQSSGSKEDSQSKAEKNEEPKPIKQTKPASVEPSNDLKVDKKDEINTSQNENNEAPEAKVVAVAEKEEMAPPVLEPEPVIPAENKEVIENTVVNEPEEKPPMTKADSVEMSASLNPTKVETNLIDVDTTKEHRSRTKDVAKVREKRSPPLRPKHKPDEQSPNTIEDGKKSSADEVKIPMRKPVTALRSAAVRPVSARPSAPRRRDRNVKQIMNHESLMQEPIESKKSDKKDLISEFDDGENIIITDIIQDTTAAANDAASDAIADGKQGHLVQQILETQTVFMNADNDGKHGESIISTDDTSNSDRKSQARNMSELRQSIQKLSLYITPLGKLMEYFQEDVDAMQIELLMWQNAHAAAHAEIKQEQNQTESLLEQFKYQLAEINNSIKEHTEQINNTATNIIQNDEKISKLIGTL